MIPHRSRRPTVAYAIAAAIERIRTGARLIAGELARLNRLGLPDDGFRAARSTSARLVRAALAQRHDGRDYCC